MDLIACEAIWRVCRTIELLINEKFQEFALSSEYVVVLKSLQRKNLYFRSNTSPSVSSLAMPPLSSYSVSSIEP